MGGVTGWQWWGDWEDLQFSFGEVYLKVPVGLPCLDVQQVLGHRSLQLKAKARVKDTDRGGSSVGEIMSSRVLGVVPWERLLFSGWHLALLTFSSLPTSLGTSLTSDLFSKCFADSSSSSLKCGVPRGFHHLGPLLCIHQSFISSPEFLCKIKTDVCNHFQEKRGSCSVD